MWFQPVSEWRHMYQLYWHISMSLRIPINWSTLRPTWVEFVYRYCKHQIMNQFRMQFYFDLGLQDWSFIKKSVHIAMKGHGSFPFDQRFRTFPVAILNFWKRGQPPKIYPNFRKLPAENFRSIFATGISGIFGWMVRFSEILQFSDFTETIQDNIKLKVKSC